VTHGVFAKGATNRVSCEDIVKESDEERCFELKLVKAFNEIKF